MEVVFNMTAYIHEEDKKMIDKAVNVISFNGLVYLFTYLIPDQC